MKVIAHTRSGLIVEMGTDEAANLTGVYGHEMKRPDVGAELDCSKLFRHIKDIQSRHDGMRQAALQLRAAADIVESALPKLALPPEQPQQTS